MVTKSKMGQTLHAALSFTEEELQANHDGYMTQGQRNALQADMPPAPLVVGLGFVVIMVLANLAGYVLIRAYDDNARSGLFEAYFGIVVVTGNLAMLGGMVKAARQRYFTRQDVHKGIVQAARGPVQLKIGRYIHLLAIDGVKFAVSEQVLLAFHHDHPYCIFYAPHLKKILSAEELY